MASSITEQGITCTVSRVYHVSATIYRRYISLASGATPFVITDSDVLITDTDLNITDTTK